MSFCKPFWGRGLPLPVEEAGWKRFGGLNQKKEDKATLRCPEAPAQLQQKWEDVP